MMARNLGVAALDTFQQIQSDRCKRALQRVSWRPTTDVVSGLFQRGVTGASSQDGGVVLME